MSIDPEPDPVESAVTLEEAAAALRQAPVLTMERMAEMIGKLQCLGDEHRRIVYESGIYFRVQFSKSFSPGGRKVILLSMRPVPPAAPLPQHVVDSCLHAFFPDPESFSNLAEIRSLVRLARNFALIS